MRHCHTFARGGRAGEAFAKKFPRYRQTRARLAAALSRPREAPLLSYRRSPPAPLDVSGILKRVSSQRQMQAKSCRTIIWLFDEAPTSTRGCASRHGILAALAEPQISPPRHAHKQVAERHALRYRSILRFSARTPPIRDARNTFILPLRFDGLDDARHRFSRAFLS